MNNLLNNNREYRAHFNKKIKKKESIKKIDSKKNVNLEYESASHPLTQPSELNLFQSLKILKT